MLSKLILMILAFVLGIYVANAYHVNLFDLTHSATQAVEKKAQS